MEFTWFRVGCQVDLAYARSCWCSMHMYAAPILRSLLIRASKPELGWGGILDFYLFD